MRDPAVAAGVRRGEPGYIYVGRKCAGLKGSALGNPFMVGVDGTVDEVLAAYETWLRRQVSYDGWSVQDDAMEAIKPDSILVCWCHPKPCHADVIVRVWEERNDHL